MWTSSRPTSIGCAPSMRASRSLGIAARPSAASVSAKRCRITQSTCAGGLGGMTDCLMKPGKRRDHVAGSPPASGRTASALCGADAGLRDDRDGLADGGAGGTHGAAPSASKMRSGVNGRCAKRTPVALASALAIAGATGLIAHSPCDLAPSGPIVS